MDGTNLILTEPVLSSTLLDDLGGISLYEKIANRQASKIDELSEAKKEQAAKDFESVLLTKLLDVMKDTIGDWGFDEDGASEQIQGLFWLYLARDIADQGGLGLWKDVYGSLSDTNQANATVESVK
jgi:Rod binding domain-containing protein